MAKQIKDMAASVHDRLLNLAKELSVDFNRLLLLYSQERFLYRLVSSEYRNYFVLKGGVLLYGVHQLKSRPTKDIDFLVEKLENKIEKMRVVISSIISQKINDGLDFDSSSLSIEEITDDSEYHGLRIKVDTYLGSAKRSLQLDMGFGDIIFPEPIKFNYPSLIEDETFEVNGYSWESVIAEKFEAIVKLSDLNSRMKDFYDIFFLMQNHDFDGSALKEAISNTFVNRDTDIKNYEYIFSPEFNNSEDKKTQWQAFIRKTKLETDHRFTIIIEQIHVFLEPPIKSILKKSEFKDQWDHASQNWSQK
jgi:predicted nucleotidyltransferase component of viral defense system